MKMIMGNINKCLDCLYYDTLQFKGYCQKVEQHLTDSHTIPEWCPLEEVIPVKDNYERIIKGMEGF